LLFTRYKNKIWFQFLFFVKATALKQQISKFYPKVQRTKLPTKHFIYFSQRPVINVIASMCLEFADKILMFAVLNQRLLQKETEGSFCF